MMNRVEKMNKEWSRILEKELQTLEKYSHIHSYPKRQIIFNEGDERDKLYFLRSGIIKIEKVDFSGNFFYLNFITNQQLFPLQGIFREPNYPFSAVAFTNVDIISISTDIFENHMKNNQDFLFGCIDYLSSNWLLDMCRIQKGVSSDSYSRLVASICVLMKKLGLNTEFNHIKIIVPITINDLSIMSGTSRETTSILIKKLIKLRKIKYERKELEIIDSQYFSDFFT